MSDLTKDETEEVIEALKKAEKDLIEELHPYKINWAQLGNLIPHLHWHLIPRFKDDPTFPDPVWSEPKRTVPEDVQKARAGMAEKAVNRIKDAFFKSPHPDQQAATKAQEANDILE